MSADAAGRYPPARLVAFLGREELDAGIVALRALQPPDGLREVDGVAILVLGNFHLVVGDELLEHFPVGSPHPSRQFDVLARSESVTGMNAGVGREHELHARSDVERKVLREVALAIRRVRRR